MKAARAAAHPVELHDLDRVERLRRFGLGDATAGCHTSLVGGYIAEVHVPLNIVARLVRTAAHTRHRIPGHAKWRTGH